MEDFMAGRDFEDLYAGGGVANPVQGKPYTGFGLTAGQKDAIGAIATVDADTASVGDVAKATEDLVAALKS
jgi:hypothetical protein